MMSSAKKSARSSAVEGVAVPELEPELGADDSEVALELPPMELVAKSME